MRLLTRAPPTIMPLTSPSTPPQPSSTSSPPTSTSSFSSPATSSWSSTFSSTFPSPSPSPASSPSTAAAAGREKLSIRRASDDLVTRLTGRLIRKPPSSVPHRLRTRRLVKRVLILVSVLLLSQPLLHLFHPSSPSSPSHRRSFFPRRGTSDAQSLHLAPSSPHPLSTRLSTAASLWRAKLSRQSRTYEEWEKEYRRRYKLEPPQGMRGWFERVRKEGHVLVDEYDGMMRELEPFRVMGGAEVRRRTLEIAKLPTFSLLNITGHHSYFYGQDYRGSGRPVSREEYGPGVERVEGFASMLQPHIDHIPDGTIFAVSELAEPRVIIPWQDHPSTLRSLSRLQALTFSSPSSSPASSNPHLALMSQTSANLQTMLSALPSPNASALLPTPNYQGARTGGASGESAWTTYARSCPPDTLARRKMVGVRAGYGGVGRATKGRGAGTKVDGGGVGKRVQKGFRKGLGRFARRSEEGAAKVDGAAPRQGAKRRWFAPRRAAHASNASSPSSLFSPSSPFTPSTSPLDPRVSDPLLAHDAPGRSYPTASLAAQSSQFSFVRNAYRGIRRDEVCGDGRVHQFQGAFFSDWRSVPAMYPVFSPSKIDGFSDILIPSNFYYGDDARYSLFESNATIPWHAKENKLFWRGETTGGGNTPPGRQLQYQRHRFVRLAQSLSRSAQSVLVPSRDGSTLTHIRRAIGDLNSAWLDVGFTGYTGCGDPDVCDKTKSLFPLKPKVPFKEMGKYKAILDLDGMAFSGRFVALMGMGSAVFKSTIYRDFAADWIEPYFHYIPLSASYDELYNTLAYFLPLPTSLKGDLPHSKPTLLRRLTGRGSSSMGDKALQQIAQNSLEWSEKIGDKPDIEAYVYRLTLEWARILNTEKPEPVEQYHLAPDAM